MANEDVAVRLTAEGVAQVVSAFRTVSAEGKKAGEEGGAAFKELSEQIKEAGIELIGFLAVGKLIDAFKESIEGVFENAETIQNFAKATGLSTDAIQGLQAAAKDAGVDFGTVESAINKMTVTIGKANSGVAAAVQPFDQLNIKLSDFKKLSPDQQFNLLITKLAGIESPAQRATTGVQLFGKQFQEIEPLIEEVNEKGLQSYIDHLREIGVLMDGETVASVKDVGDQMLELKQRAEGLTTQFISGLIPALQQGLDGFLKASNDGADGLKTVGEAVGTVLKGVVLVAIIVAKTIADVIGSAVQQTKTYINSTADALAHLAAGDFSEAGQSLVKGFTDGSSDLANFADSVKKDAAKTYNDLFGDEEKKPEHSQEGGKPKADAEGDAENVAQLKALGQARFQLISAQLDSELQLYQAHASLLEEQDKEQYESGKISLQQYYADRAKIISDQFDKEIQTLQAKRAAAAAVPVSDNSPAEAVQRQAQLAQIDGQIQLKQVARQQALAENTNEQRQAQKQLYDEQLQAESKLASLQGNRGDAAKAQLNLQLEQLDEVLRKAGTADDVREQALATARSQGEALANFNEQTQAADAAMKSLTTGTASIQDDVNNGLIFQADGEEKIIELEKERLPLLQKIADAQLAAAKASNDPQAIATAEAFQQKLKDIATATNTAGKYMAQFKAGVQDAFQNGLDTWLENGLQGIHNLGQAFKSLVVDILSGIEKVAAQEASESATKGIFSAISSLGSSFFPAFAKGGVFDGGSVVHAFASGGAFTNSIASSPTVAPMALFGEAGPEAIMPLTKDGSGRLGVAAHGAGGGDFNVTTQVNIDNSGNAQTSQQANQQQAASFGNKLTGLVKQTISDEMRPGGMLWRWKNGS